MKPKSIIGLALLVGFTALLFLNFEQQVGGYMTFDEAATSGAKAHVVGYWVTDKPHSYDAEQNIFSFYMEDEKGTVREVHYASPKPANFEDAERVVVEGKLAGEIFVADHILIKCPSKYNETQSLPEVETASGT